MATKKTASIQAFGALQNLTGKGSYRLANGCAFVHPDGAQTVSGVNLSYPEHQIPDANLSPETLTKIEELKALLDVDYSAYNDLIESGKAVAVGGPMRLF
jgi:hypothetical protein